MNNNWPGYYSLGPSPLSRNAGYRHRELCHLDRRKGSKLSYTPLRSRRVVISMPLQMIGLLFFGSSNCATDTAYVIFEI
jgi:hypothetical protein